MRNVPGNQKNICYLQPLTMGIDVHPLTAIPHRIPLRSKTDGSTRARLNLEQKSSPLDSYTI